jgi:superfamily II DNA or RNA helicase
MITEYTPGKLVRLRDRDWMVLPSDDPDVLMVKPLGGSEDEITGIYRPLHFQNEHINETTFEPPDVHDLGAFSRARLLLNAARLSFRNATGPFRCVGRLSFRPRAYQMVPLIMALKQEFNRLLIADDVGVGKTVEALLIVKELLERREIKRFAVVCPPHLCEQWRAELKEKFDIDAVIIRSNTQASLDRKIHGDVSVFTFYPFQIISIDYIKSEQRRQIFINECPELVIVDEAHTCTKPVGADRNQQQRHSLVHAISTKENQHLVLLTATPHSGKNEQFQSLLGLLKPEFEHISLSEATQNQRREIAGHFIQRKRSDVEHWMGEDTQFPKRTANELDYDLSNEYKSFFFQHMLPFTQDLVKPGKDVQKKKAHFWTALALLRGVMSSPDAGIQMLKNRIDKLPVSTEELEGDVDGANPVYDKQDASFENDAAPSQLVEQTDWSASQRAQLKSFITQLDQLRGLEKDKKAFAAFTIIEDWVQNGHSPVVFCRYIDTAKYLKEVLKEKLIRKFKKLDIQVITSEFPDELRKEKIDAMNNSQQRLLIATDCLSEGINLQESFNTVLHYDLPWNPNRLEQREGRVDRFGQIADEVFTTLIYGKDNPIDGVVFRVILDKVRLIKKDTGYSVPFPEDTESVMDTILNAVLLNPNAGRQFSSSPDQQLGFEFEDEAEVMRRSRIRLSNQIEEAQKREQVSRSIFAQHAIKAQDIEEDLKQTDDAIGSPEAVEEFVTGCLPELFSTQIQRFKGVWKLFTANLPDLLKRHVPRQSELLVTFFAPQPEGVLYLGRNHPFVEQMAHLVLGHTVSTEGAFAASRASVIRSKDVQEQHTLMLLRVRNVIEAKRRNQQIVAEEMIVWGFTGSLNAPTPIDQAAAHALLRSVGSSSNVPEVAQARLLTRTVDSLPSLEPIFEEMAEERSKKLTEAHERYRQFVGGSSFEVVYPVQPMDILGVYIIQPEISL